MISPLCYFCRGAIGHAPDVVATKIPLAFWHSKCFLQFKANTQKEPTPEPEKKIKWREFL